MKKTIIRVLSLALALVMLLGAIPFAAADTVCQHADTDNDGYCDNEGCDEAVTPQQPSGCQHTETETKYESLKDGTHLRKVACVSCGQPVDEDVENCVDFDENDECDICHEEMSDEEPPCEHTDTTETIIPGTDGKHVRKTVCNAADCKVEVEKTEDCADEDGDKKCDVCGAEIQEKPVVYISCAQDGYETTPGSKDMTFVLHGVEAADVTWSFSASGSASPSLSQSTATGASATITVTGGLGVAKITATAKWADGEVSGTFYLSFYTRTAVTVYVKEGKKSFRFTDTDVFSKISNIHPDKVKNYSLYRFLVDGNATRVILYENRRANEDAGMITYKTSGKFYQYDPEDYNDYSIGDLEDLMFTVVGEGTYKLNYELYEMSGSKGYATTRGTINIVVGEPGDEDLDIVYRTNGEAVTFDVQDFTDYFEDNCTDITEELDYVKFHPENDAYGLLYLDKTQRGIVKESYKFLVKYQGRPNTYELDDVTYVPDPREDRYTEELDFTAYGDRDTVIRGTVTIILGDQIEFTDVKESDWFYDEVAYVYSKGIMNGISDTSFAPNATLTRAMVVTMLYRVAGEPKVTGSDAFSDVKSGQWYTEAVQWAADNDIVEGMGNGKFAPETAITREQLAAILYRYADYERLGTSYGGTSLKDFRDDNKVSTWAEDAMKWAVYMKIMEGSNSCLNPKNTATRAEAAAMFQRFMEMETDD